ncbi:DUF3231 family protein [Rossellomorea vietnamensis]|uniref:DUF3231 family protein n=1 Tax=Rossellomorea vietnamensis TaxID=218284 RepID=A0A5D4NYR8_9BACI|nr:DUF3231 family protein [Rossellomorea vietnamensis]
MKRWRIFVEKSTHIVSLSSAETANLWTQYINDSLSICMLTHAVSKVKDEEIKEVLNQSISMAQTHLSKITEFFNREGQPIPKGFTIENEYESSSFVYGYFRTGLYTCHDPSWNDRICRCCREFSKRRPDRLFYGMQSGDDEAIQKNCQSDAAKRTVY